ncbi:MAG: YicC family protein [Paracoccaceae bacterium]|nr:YicC family protein [Paracoccaceae bacterium]MDG2259135.1 YicC family protein [Paracoccaceae bacterium]
MTGFASGQGADGAFQWIWDIRSVNSKGLDVRMRVPDWVSGLEADLKPMITKAINRGSVSLSLRVSRGQLTSAIAVNPSVLDATLAAISVVEAAAMDKGLSLTPATAADILNVRGVLDQSSDDKDTGDLKKMLLKDFQPILADFVRMRDQEGKALDGILSEQIDTIENLVTQASSVLDQRRADLNASYKNTLQRIVENTDGLDKQRIEQEIALAAVKTDVMEEIDRLVAHIGAARKLLKEGVKIGRMFDFLSQEFNREANTLCSKSQHKELTAIGLELKAVIDQMREQVQNVE